MVFSAVLALIKMVCLHRPWLEAVFMKLTIELMHLVV
jgi:hypothetical protein